MRTVRISGRAAAALAVSLAGAACLSGPAFADRINHPTAVFAGLDKITGRIISFDVAIDETVQFGALQVTPRVCSTRPQTEAPHTTTFVEVDDVGDGAAANYKRIFGGWMFAASPGLHAVEHPVYDVWLSDCKGGKDIIKTPAEVATAPTFEEPLRQPRPGTTPRDPNAPRPQRPAATASAPAPAALPPPVAAAPRQPARAFFPTNAPRAAPDIAARESAR